MSAMTESHYRVLRLLQENPHLTQRELSDRLQVSLGKTNYILQALVSKGLVKARNFKKSNNKAAYSYLLTPSGIEEKARMTVEFLRIKMQEYEVLKQEIADLQRETEDGR